MKILRIFRKDNPLISRLCRQLLPGRTLLPVLRLPDHSPDGRDRHRRPTPNPPKGEAFWFEFAPAFSLPHWGRGTARNERWMRDASDKLMLPDFVTLTMHRAFKLGYISQERFSDVGLSWLRAYRGASRPLGSKKTFFGHVGGARFARLTCVLKTCVLFALLAWRAS